ncbi:MAG: hypothetical protein HY869_24270 [Chloroflexi bacterium]|nr:hypothetical protein [Chloroflexota bacterium]
MKPITPLLPPRLRPGDTIGIVSPSTPVNVELDGQFRNGVRFLESLGFKCSRWIYNPAAKKSEGKQGELGI